MLAKGTRISQEGPRGLAEVPGSLGHEVGRLYLIVTPIICYVICFFPLVLFNGTGHLVLDTVCITEKGCFIYFLLFLEL